jgi:hypothetical protein
VIVKKTGETLKLRFGIDHPSTRALVDADALPTGTLLVNGVASAAAVTVAKTATGTYTATVTVPTLADGDVLQVWIAYALGGVSMGAVVWDGDGGEKHPSDLSDEIDALDTVPLASGGSAPAAGTLTIRRGDTVTLTVEGLGSLAGRSQLWFGGKKSTDDADADALAIVEETDGLLVCNEVDADDLDADQTGTLTVDDEAAGDITIVLSAAATAALPIRSTAYWDVQMRTASGVTTLAAGALVVTADVVRAVE